MAAITEEDVEQIALIEGQCCKVKSKAKDLVILLRSVSQRIRLDDPLNDGTDFAVVMAAYQPKYDATLSELEALVTKLPKRSQT